jgi:hypothetical protein
LLAACGGTRTLVATQAPARRDLSACERALDASESSVALEHAGRRFVIGLDHVTIIDAACKRILSHVTLRDSEGGPSLTETAWRDVSRERIDHLHATDALFITTTRRVEQFGSVLVVLSLGARDELQFGYQAHAFRCDNSECRTTAFAHFEFMTAPVEGCHPFRSSVEENRPLFRLLEHDGTIVVEQSYSEHHCQRGATRTVWRTVPLR